MESTEPASREHFTNAVLRDEEIYKLIVESIQDYAIFMLHPDGRVATWNKGAKRIKGYEPHEIIGKHFSQFYLSEEKSIKPAFELDEATRFGRFEDEGWRVRKDGSKFWANVIITRLNDPNGKLIGFAKVTRDLTERRRSEQNKIEEQKNLAVLEQVQENEKILDQIFSEAPSFMTLLSVPDYRYLKSNAQHLNLIRKSDILGKTLRETQPELEAQGIFALLDQVVKTGKPFVGKEVPIQYEASNELSPKTVYLDFVYQPLKRPDGTIYAIAAQGHDVTEKVLAKKRALFLSEASTVLVSSLDYQKTLQSLAQITVPEMADWCTVTMVNKDGAKERLAMVHWDPNKTALIEELSRNYPANPEEDSGIGYVIKTGKSLFTPKVSDSDLAKAAKDQRHLEIMRELACYSCIVAPITARGQVLGAISLVSGAKHRIYNESDLKLAEELGRRAGIAIDNSMLFEATEQAVRTRDEFVSIASHELKTPLTSLKLQAQIKSRDIKKGDLKRFAPDKLPKLIADDEKQINRLIRLVDDMLDVSRINSGKLSLLPEEFNLGEMVQETLSRFSAQIEERKSRVQIQIDPNVIGNWDRFRLEQVFINLLTNALKYGDSKPIDIQVSSTQGYAVLSIRDQGLGIDPKDQERIFEQFERAVSVNSISGFGLGLYITKKIIQAHMGTIQVESELGKGSTFRVTLPLN